MNTQDLIRMYEEGMLLTAEQLEQIADGSGKVKFKHKTPKHISVKSTKDNNGVIFPANGQIDRDVLKEIWKAFKACGFVLLALAMLYGVHLLGVI